MELGTSLTGAVRVSVVTVLSSVLLTQTAGAQAVSAPGGAEASRLVAKLDREMFRQRLRAAGYRCSAIRRLRVEPRVFERSSSRCA
jgi:hypothetical protein